MRTYKTIQGDMWDGIAYKTMGSTSYAGELMAKNRAYLDCYTFPAGIVLELPEEQTEMSGTLPPWKRRAGQ